MPAMPPLCRFFRRMPPLCRFFRSDPRSSRVWLDQIYPPRRTWPESTAKNRCTRDVIENEGNHWQATNLNRRCPKRECTPSPTRHLVSWEVLSRPEDRRSQNTCQEGSHVHLHRTNDASTQLFHKNVRQAPTVTVQLLNLQNPVYLHLCHQVTTTKPMERARVKPRCRDPWFHRHGNGSCIGTLWETHHAYLGQTQHKIAKREDLGMLLVKNTPNPPWILPASEGSFLTELTGDVGVDAEMFQTVSFPDQPQIVQPTMCWWTQTPRSILGIITSYRILEHMLELRPQVDKT